jgi:hypothetical protein
VKQAQADADSGDRVQAADFSALGRPGRCTVAVPGVGPSEESVYVRLVDDWLNLRQGAPPWRR